MFLAGPKSKNPYSSKLASDLWPFNPGIILYYFERFLKIGKRKKYSSRLITFCQSSLHFLFLYILIISDPYLMARIPQYPRSDIQVSCTDHWSSSLKYPGCALNGEECCLIYDASWSAYTSFPLIFPVFSKTVNNRSSYAFSCNPLIGQA